MANVRGPAMLDEVLAGLRASPKTLPPKLLYDVRGAALFEEITALDEYYLTRTEVSIFETWAREIIQRIGAGSTLVEFGSGDGRKVRILLDAARHLQAYVPVDIAREQLDVLTLDLVRQYPDLTVVPVVGDFTAAETIATVDDEMSAAIGHASRRIAFFPGSTIGNFHFGEAVEFLRGLRELCGSNGGLVIGADLRKDPEMLHAAYNDARGVTAEFNRNVLHRLNRECDADFAVDCFRHYAFYNPIAHRIEMHLVSLADQHVHVAGETIAFARGESIWTESSYKYDDPSMRTLLAGAGWAIQNYWSDAARLFGVWYCEPLSEPSV